MQVRYFSGTEQVYDPMPMYKDKFRASFGSASAIRCDSFTRMVGFAQNTHSSERLKFVGAKPITRVIKFKSNPSLHECDARCRNAKGNACECSCGGQFHGAG